MHKTYVISLSLLFPVLLNLANREMATMRSSDSLVQFSEFKFESKINLPSSKKYHRLSIICDQFWLALPEWHMILVVSETGDIVKEVAHKYIKQPKVVKGVLDEDVVIIGAHTGLFCMSAFDHEKCSIINDGNIIDLDISKDFLYAYETKSKSCLIYRKTMTDWIKIKAVRIPKGRELDRIVYCNEKIFMHFDDAEKMISVYTKTGDPEMEFKLENDKRSPKHSSKMCCVTADSCAVLLNWYKSLVEYYLVKMIAKDSPESQSIKRLKEIKLVNINNPNDMVMTGKNMYILAGLNIVKYDCMCTFST